MSFGVWTALKIWLERNSKSDVHFSKYDYLTNFSNSKFLFNKKVIFWSPLSRTNQLLTKNLNFCEKNFQRTDEKTLFELESGFRGKIWTKQPQNFLTIKKRTEKEGSKDRVSPFYVFIFRDKSRLELRSTPSEASSCFFDRSGLIWVLFRVLYWQSSWCFRKLLTLDVHVLESFKTQDVL